MFRQHITAIRTGTAPPGVMYNLTGAYRGIFSNIFGVIKADDKIPDYKLKQGESFENLKINPKARAEDLKIENWFEISRLLSTEI